MDTRTPEQRRRIMQSVRQKNTGPEMAVRRAAHRLGYRYRLHVAMPGKPDLVFPRRRRIVFVNGCFWHGHKGCQKGAAPKSRQSYWLPKIRRNIERDAAVATALASEGWDVLTIWQCETLDSEALQARLRAFLGPPKNPIDKPRRSR